MSLNGERGKDPEDYRSKNRHSGDTLNSHMIDGIPVARDDTADVWTLPESTGKQFTSDEKLTTIVRAASAK